MVKADLSHLLQELQRHGITAKLTSEHCIHLEFKDGVVGYLCGDDLEWDTNLKTTTWVRVRKKGRIWVIEDEEAEPRLEGTRHTQIDVEVNVDKYIFVERVPAWVRDDVGYVKFEDLRL